ncbi:MAG: magnesium transporter [Ignavibacteriae bacterium]|nr:magnesium transporter [Ignavibacteriota bacterium]
MSEESKNKSVLDIDNSFLDDITDLIHEKSDAALINIITDLYDFDIAVILDNLKEDEDALYLFSLLNIETAGEVILEISDDRREYIAEKLNSEKISRIVSEMHSDDATDFVSELDSEKKDEVLDNLDKIDREDSHEVRELLKYDESTAGGIMGKEYIAVNQLMTVTEAVSEIQEKAEEVDQFYNLWIVDNDNRLVGILSLKRLFIALKYPEKTMGEIMNPDVISVEEHMDQEEVAKIFQSYDLVSLPVVDSEHKIVGKISIDDIVDVIEEEYSENVARMAGTDAEELEKKSPFQIAKLRLPWLIVTLLIELIAVFVVQAHDEILGKVILLAAFMPIISAISGNTGLQSAAIVVRGLDTGNININRWWEPLGRQFKTNLIIGSAVALIVGLTGYLLSDTESLKFAMSVAISMFISINIAGLIGTMSPMLSKRLGFDPAITSGPFETAFQDVIGISIFLTISTFLLTH